MEKSLEDVLGPVDAATTLYTQVFHNLTTHWQNTQAFRRLAGIGLPAATQVTQEQNERAASEFLADPSNESLFLDKKGFLDFVGGVSGMSAAMTKNEVGAFRGAVDEASLVLLHSAVDAALTDLCRVSALRAPRDWYPSVQGRRVTLQEATEKTADEMLALKIEDALRELERGSLLDRADRLIALCSGSIDPNRINGYSFDRKRLEALDSQRHDLVHRPDPKRSTIPGIEDSLKFLHRSGLYLWAQLNSKYGIKLDLGHALRSSKRSGI